MKNAKMIIKLNNGRTELDFEEQTLEQLLNLWDWEPEQKREVKGILAFDFDLVYDLTTKQNEWIEKVEKTLTGAVSFGVLKMAHDILEKWITGTDKLNELIDYCKSLYEHGDYDKINFTSFFYELLGFDTEQQEKDEI